MMVSAGTCAAVDASPLSAKAYKYRGQWLDTVYQHQIPPYRWCRGSSQCFAWDHSGKNHLPPQGGAPAPGQNGPGVVFFNPPPENGHSGSFGGLPPPGPASEGSPPNWGNEGTNIEPIADIEKVDLPPPHQGPSGPGSNPFDAPGAPPQDQGPTSGPTNPGNPGTPSSPVVNTAVPEPAAWLMMIAGFGLMGGALRSQRINAKMARSAQ